MVTINRCRKSEAHNIASFLKVRRVRRFHDHHHIIFCIIMQDAMHLMHILHMMLYFNLHYRTDSLHIQIVTHVYCPMCS